MTINWRGNLSRILMSLGTTAEVVEGFSSSWSTLRNLSEGTWVRSSYFWLIVVPVAANALSKVDSEVSINLGLSTIQIALGLPFSWKVFYFSALSFAAAGFIYRICCPSVVREYTGFAEFTDVGKGSNYLLNQYLTYAVRSRRKSSNQLDYFLLNFTDGLAWKTNWSVMTFECLQERIARSVEPNPDEGTDFRFPHEEETFLGKNPLYILESKLAEAFWFIKNDLEAASSFPRVVCSYFYYLGYGGFLYIAAQGLQSVFKLL